MLMSKASLLVWTMGHALLAAVGTTVPHSVLAQDATAAILARTYSTNYLMRRECTAFFAVDVEEANRIGDGLLRLGRRKVGAALMESLVDEGLSQRRSEVVASGISHWCGYQRARMLTSGVTTIFR